eukprot:g38438.t1
MVHELVTKSALGLTDVQETTSGAIDTVGQVRGCTGESLWVWKDCLGHWMDATGEVYHHLQLQGKVRVWRIDGECGANKGVAEAASGKDVGLQLVEVADDNVLDAE